MVVKAQIEECDKVLITPSRQKVEFSINCEKKKEEEENKEGGGGRRGLGVEG